VATKTARTGATARTAILEFSGLSRKIMLCIRITSRPKPFAFKKET
jgi:hypothetical protein